MNPTAHFRKRNLKKLGKKLGRTNKKFVFACIFVFVGIATLLYVRAATPTAHFEPENATLSGTTKVTDTSSSGGNFLQFNDASTLVADQGYELVFSDEFDGPLNTNVWVPQPWYTNVFPSYGATTANGLLTLKTTAANSYGYVELTSLGPRSATYPHRPNAKVWQEGYFEVRARYTNDPWAWPAIWFLSHQSGNLESEARDCSILNAEWDMVENGIGMTHADTRAYSVLHSNTNGTCGVPDAGRSYSKNGANLSGWHVWSGKWTADQVCTWVDGGPIGCQSTYDTTSQPMYMILQINTVRTPPAGTGPKLPEYEMQVDWVRVWQKPQ